MIDTPLIAWIADQRQRMIEMVETWSSINSGSSHLKGLNRLAYILINAFACLKGRSSLIKLAPTLDWDNQGACLQRHHGAALLIRKRPKAPLRILLGGHMDTVFEASSSFQKPWHSEPDILKGPGVADMKGGLAILLIALQAFELSPFSHLVGWDVLITPDEEIGSIASLPLWRQCAWRNHYALIFEPSLPDGAFVSQRKGSFTYHLLAHGKSAHAGRDFHQAVNAVAALAQLAIAMNKLNSAESDLTVNIGTFQGGTTANSVPDSASCLINIRASTIASLLQAERFLYDTACDIENKTKATLAIYPRGRRPPKPCHTAAQHLLSLSQIYTEQLGIAFHQRPAGGVCDGNILAAEGLPTLDSLGAVGGNLHTHDEWLLIPSLVQRSQLAAHLLLGLAKDAFSPKPN